MGLTTPGFVKAITVNIGEWKYGEAALEGYENYSITLFFILFFFTLEKTSQDPKNRNSFENRNHPEKVVGIS